MSWLWFLLWFCNEYTGNKTSNGWESGLVFDTRNDDGKRCAKEMLSVESKDDDDNGKRKLCIGAVSGGINHSLSRKCSARWKICVGGHNPISSGYGNSFASYGGFFAFNFHVIMILDLNMLLFIGFFAVIYCNFHRYFYIVQWIETFFMNIYLTSNCMR